MGHIVDYPHRLNLHFTKSKFFLVDRENLQLFLFINFRLSINVDDIKIPFSNYYDIVAVVLSYCRPRWNYIYLIIEIILWTIDRTVVGIFI